MAVHAPIMGAPLRASASSPSRRGLLGALTAASLFAASGAARVDPGAVAGAEDMNMMTSIAGRTSPISGPSEFEIAAARFRIARARFEALPDHLEMSDREAFEREEDALHAAWEVAEMAPIHSWEDFVGCYALSTDDGSYLMPEKVMWKLLTDAKRLLAHSA